MPQKRSAIFTVDIKGNPYRLSPKDFVVRVRQIIDVGLYTDSTGHLDEAKSKQVFANKIDTTIQLDADFSFRLKDMDNGSAYRVIVHYNIPLDTYRRDQIARTRMIIQEFKVNSWTYQYTIKDLSPCDYNGSLKNRTCPKCHKQDKVMPIVYEEPPAPPSEDEDLEGPAAPAAKQSLIVGYNAGGTVTGCDANWHCGRDRMDF